MSKLQIFLADDHAVMRKGLKLLVCAEPDMEVVGEAGDGRTTLQKVKDLQPDVVVMDVSMPELNGIQTTERLMQASQKIKVLILTAYDDYGYVRQLLRVGASGYVLKNAAAEELTNAIRVVAKGGVYLDPTVAGKVVDGLISKKKVSSESPSCDLSEREQEVLRLTAWGYINKEIATQLKISVKTVETHKANFMKKLNFQSRADIVRYALRQGWLQES